MDTGNDFFLGAPFSLILALKGSFFRVLGGFPKLRGAPQFRKTILMGNDDLLQHCCRQYF